MSEIQNASSGTAVKNAYAASTHQDRRTLDVIFQHPVSHNLTWRDVVALLTNIGDVDDKKGGELAFHAKGETLSMRKPRNKDLPADDLMTLRHFLTRAGWAPDAMDQAAATAPAMSAPDIVVVIDHSGARVFKIGTEVGDEAAESQGDGQVRHLEHSIDRADHDRDREEDFPEDIRFFEQVSAALVGRGKIALIGHGKGQSNEAHHLSTYLEVHQRHIQERISATLTADLKHLTAGELIELGRDAMARPSSDKSSPH